MPQLKTLNLFWSEWCCVRELQPAIAIYLFCYCFDLREKRVNLLCFLEGKKPIERAYVLEDCIGEHNCDRTVFEDRDFDLRDLFSGNDSLIIKR